MSGQQTYERSEVVQYYARYSADLQPPENRFLARFGEPLRSMCMLDIGVGAGRTTPHFASRAKSYTGIDYSHGMIAACRRKFADQPAWRFEYGDARDLCQFAERSFDFVLFSYNGLDYVSHRDRLLALSQIARVCRPGGLFLF